MIAGRAGDTLEEARATIGLRSVHYGAPEQSFTTTAHLWSAWLTARHSAVSLSPADVGVMQGCSSWLASPKIPPITTALDAAAYLALAQAIAAEASGRGRA